MAGFVHIWPKIDVKQPRIFLRVNNMPNRQRWVEYPKTVLEDEDEDEEYSTQDSLA